MKTLRRRALAALAAPLLLLGACADLLSGPGRAVTGLTIEDAAGAVLVTVQGESVSGVLTVARGGERPLVVTLRGPGGPLVPTLAETVRVTVTNPGVASWEDLGSGTGVLRGASAGATTLRVDLLRAGSAVYTSPAVRVEVG
jgi:hypothetical protein